MTEQRLRELYRQSVAAGTEPADDANVVAALTGSGSASEREIGLDRLAAMPGGPALARIAMALAPESERLSSELAARRGRVLRSRWPAAVALAAGLGAVAVLTIGVQREPAPLDTGSDRILASSFESDAPAAESPRIFSGDFDS